MPNKPVKIHMEFLGNILCGRDNDDRSDNPMFSSENPEATTCWSCEVKKKHYTKSNFKGFGDWINSLGEQDGDS